ncbi:LPS export ABC transporter permease LptG [Candidatus Endobugula sertula]|uniref:LPS export ABC transporter permease LptG n=1 Tax=Candidatus Endobugula sertula TaxID=62101 RepID=A0A1D2QQQ5_9GAMM|nr:LPS export ABC transporter permease LptG [Candidatus Endobugula sertula]
MRLLDSYIFRTTVAAIVIVLLIISSLDLLAKLIDELGNLTDLYTFSEALMYVALGIPVSFYQFMPFAALVGGLVGLGSLASTSELVVMRAAGVSLLRLTWAVLKPVLLFIVAMLLFAEYVIPVSDQYAESRRSMLLQGKNKAVSSREGFWNREGNEFMHFNSVQTNGKLSGITRYRYDSQGFLYSSSFAELVLYINGRWREENVTETLFSKTETSTKTYASRYWDTTLSPKLLTVLVQDTDNLAISKLYRYANYLEKQNLGDENYWLVYWGKVLQPLVIISLVLVAISFIFGPLREATMGYRIFTGVVVGIVFQIVQKLMGPASLIYGLSPLLAVLLPIVFCLAYGLFLLSRTR